MQVVYIGQLPLLPHTHNNSQVAETVTCEHCASRLNITIDDVMGVECDGGYTMWYHVVCPVCYHKTTIADDVLKRLEKSGEPIIKIGYNLYYRGDERVNI